RRPPARSRRVRPGRNTGASATSARKRKACNAPRHVERKRRRDAPPFLFSRERIVRKAVDGAEDDPMIRKLKSGGYRLYSRKTNPKTGRRRNLGTFKTRAAAEKHEREVQYFKRH